MPEALEWAFSIQDRFSSPLGKLQAQLEKVETKAVRAAKTQEDMFAKAALRMQRENEKAALATQKAQERAQKAQERAQKAQERAHNAQMRQAVRAAKKQEDMFAKAALRMQREQEKATAAIQRAQERAHNAHIRQLQKESEERRKLLKEAGGAIGGALGGAFGGRGGAEIGAIVGGFAGGGFGMGAMLGIGTAVVTTLIESIKRLFEAIFDSVKEISMQVLEHIRSIDASKFSLKQQLGEEQVKELERFNQNKDVLTSFSNNLGLLEEMEKKLVFATGGKASMETIERAVQVINEMNSIRGGGVADAQQMTDMLTRFAATGKIRPSKFFMDFFGGENAVASMFGIKGSEADVRKKLEKMFTGGEISFEDLINRTSNALAGKSGGAVGATAVKRATETIAGAWDRLLNLPQVWAQRMESSGAAARIVAIIDKIMTALEGPMGDAFTGLIKNVLGMIEGFLSDKDRVNGLVATISSLIGMIPGFISAAEKAVEILIRLMGVVTGTKSQPVAEHASVQRIQDAIGTHQLGGIPTKDLLAAARDTTSGQIDKFTREALTQELGTRGYRVSAPHVAIQEGKPTVIIDIEHIHAGDVDDPDAFGKQLAKSLQEQMDAYNAQ